MREHFTADSLTPPRSPSLYSCHPQLTDGIGTSERPMMLNKYMAWPRLQSWWSVSSRVCHWKKVNLHFQNNFRFTKKLQRSYEPTASPLHCILLRAKISPIHVNLITSSSSFLSIDLTSVRGSDDLQSRKYNATFIFHSANNVFYVP